MLCSCRMGLITFIKTKRLVVEIEDRFEGIRLSTVFTQTAIYSFAGMPFVQKTSPNKIRELKFCPHNPAHSSTFESSARRTIDQFQMASAVSWNKRGKNVWANITQVLLRNEPTFLCASAANPDFVALVFAIMIFLFNCTTTSLQTLYSLSRFSAKCCVLLELWGYWIFLSYRTGRSDVARNSNAIG